ncbi:hypothetical protein [Deinococcus sp.]|uniref:hypothetical protein n=1 Tax=Deinococcus sp. TaxID=47478 RepID=UPI003B59808E
MKPLRHQVRPLMLCGLLGGFLIACGQASPPGSTPDKAPTLKAALTGLSSSGLRYNGVWIKSSTPNRLITGWTQADFVAENARLAAQGYAITNLNAVTLPGDQIRYNAIWQHGPSTDRRWVAGWSSSDFWKKYSDLNAQGYCLKVFNAFTNSAQSDFWYNAIWTRCGVKPSFTPSLEVQFLAGDVAAQAAKGKHLSHLSSRIQSGRQYHTVLYTPQSAARPWIAGWTQSDLVSEVARLGAQGYGLSELNAVSWPGNAVRFDAIWEKSSAARPVRWNYTPADFQAEIDKLSAQGYVPINVSAFVLN